MGDFLKESLSGIGLDPKDELIFKLNKYYEMLVEKNKVMNLTAITEYDDVVIKHFVDSILISNAFDMENINSIIDVGTGAGFPGLVLGIFYPDVKITLLDSLNKRIKFLQEVVAEIDLKCVDTIHSRAEDYSQIKGVRESYDLAVSRAVANLSTLSEYCMPYVKVGGYFVSYKADNCDEEVEQAKSAIKKLGGVVDNIVRCKIPNTDITRVFVVIKKISNTDKKYPRKAGLPLKEPLQ